MANILVDKFTYTSNIDRDRDAYIVKIYADNIFVKEKLYSTVTFTQQSALDAAKSNTETFGEVGKNFDFYELRPLPEASTTPPIESSPNGEGTSTEVIIVEKQLPEPVIPTPTPAETNAKREEKDTKDSETQEINKTELEVSAQPTPTPDDGPKGQEKIALLIVKKAQDLVTLLIPIIITTATKIGIKALGKAKEKLPDTCLPQKELKKILDIRNKLIDQLNNVNATINILTKPIDTLVEIVDANEKILTGLNVAKLALQIAIPLVPTSPPGLPDLANPSIIAVTAIPDIEDFLKNNITSIKNPIYSLKKSKDHVNIIFLKLINLLKSLDKYLIGCGIKNELIPLSPSLQALDETQNQQILDAQNVNAVDFPSSVYKGFTLDIVKEPFSPTVNRVKAVAKNPQGIILLQTPLSFTTTPQTLISNIKLIIDLNPNLKAQ